ncbi:hydantoinase/oxoprolinase family protein [Clostridium sediminicola]|uniref:hydantoinase/oxoprolinase family protein n=1 Tax=Clostridium sediminicola TaxID=3114879 RepID=UPI0031F255F0
MKIGIGIDTGGTYTDAVVYNFENSEILGLSKSLTTKDDLSLGIGNALDGLPQKLMKEVELISLSTTLATNACIEDKGGRAKLIFIGIDQRIVQKVGKSYGLPSVEEILFLESKSLTSGEILEEPDFTLLKEYCKDLAADTDVVGIVELNAMYNNAILEKKAKNIIKQNLDIPVICGYELFSELNSIKRGSSALLNARLIPIITSFLTAIKSALKERNINVPIVIVRSDGTLMSEEFTYEHPIETLLCGPAASVRGGFELTGEKDCLVVDMGGTTTDIAIVKKGFPIKSVNGINIGNWKTFVDGLFIDTFGLGGDSAVRYRDSTLFLDTNRVIPLSIIAKDYPSVIQQLKRLITSKKTHSYFLHEFYYLVKDIDNNPNYNETEKAFCAKLKSGPLIFSEAAAAINKDIYNFKMDRLEKEGIIIRCGLTPTDIMHIKGDFCNYNVEAAKLGAMYVAMCINCDLDTVCEMVYNEVKLKLYCNIVRILLQHKNKNYRKSGLSESMNIFIKESYEIAKNLKEHSFLDYTFTTSATLIGIGAPIHVFLSDVAELLGTKAIIPKYAHVANALGAVLGNITATSIIEIKPDLSTEGICGYIVYGKEENRYFNDLEQATEFAKIEADISARQEAKKRGALGDISISTKIKNNTACGSMQDKDVLVYLGTEVISTAVARIEL